MVEKHILGIDWGRKRVGFAYMHNDVKIPLPLGFTRNDSAVYDTIRQICEEKKIDTIICGKPASTKLQEEIEAFIDQLSSLMSSASVTVHYVGEGYSSVEAGVRLKDHGDHIGKDSVAAMIILERYLGGNKGV